ncbi:hypothetical protein V6N12_017414 [Hibiscus sabdariffa]|uniref:Uncharacterized protein n=1 Tax=Hibiscus sabdariffa TaxID=183260 RepID=A0ABR2CHH5_9ROSI
MAWPGGILISRGSNPFHNAGSPSSAVYGSDGMDHTLILRLASVSALSHQPSFDDVEGGGAYRTGCSCKEP